MKHRLNFSLLSFLSIVLFFTLSACHSNDDVRQPKDIMGVWSQSDNKYIIFGDDNTVKNFSVTYQDNESIGYWGEDDVYYYEPGYNLVIYVTASQEADVYQIVSMGDNQLTWCPVDKIEDTNRDDIGKVIGEIINKAQEGYTLYPELYQTFYKISDLQFDEMLEQLDLILYPWDIEE